MKANIFVQDTEPSKKDGIWLKMSGKTAEHYVSDDNIFTGGTWESIQYSPTIPFSFSEYGASILVGSNAYLISGTSMYKFNLLDYSCVQLSNLPFNFTRASASAVGTDIYLFSSNTDVYKYDTLTDTYTQLNDAPSSRSTAGVITVGTNIYSFGAGNGANCYKYDTLTDTWTSIKNITTQIVNGYANGALANVGNDIYILAGYYNTKKHLKYDILTDSYTKLDDLPVDFQYGAMCNIGNENYYFWGSSAYKYDILNRTHIKLDDIPTYFRNEIANGIVKFNNNVYLFYGTVVKIYHPVSKTYETDNTVVVAQGRTYSVGYNTKLFETNFEDDFQPLYGFADAWFYTLQNGLDGTMPVYYGDGTQWINIKNPPPQYTELEYIESTGTQYIDTGILPSNDIKIKLEIKDIMSDEKMIISGTSTWNINRFLMAYYQGSLRWYANGEVTANTSASAKNEIELYRGSFKLNNQNISTNTDSLTLQDLTNIFVFGSSYLSNKNNSFKLYYLQLLDDNVLVRDFIPVKDENNVVCLYDKVTEDYFYNSGTGTFTAGPEVQNQGGAE